MSTTITVKGVANPWPTEGEVGYATQVYDVVNSIATEMLTKLGGSYHLEADLDCGANYGIKVPYITSRDLDSAASGIVRLATGDTIAWRNNADTADIALSKDSSDNLKWGTEFVTTDIGTQTLTNKTLSSPVLSGTTTAGDIDSSGNVSCDSLSAVTNIRTYDGLTVDNDAAIGGDVYVTGTVKATVKIETACTLAVSGNSSLAGDLEVYGNISDPTGMVTINDSLDVLGEDLWLNGVLRKAASGSPEGVVTAPIGSMYHRDDGGPGTTLYVKESGTGNTGWVAQQAGEHTHTKSEITDFAHSHATSDITSGTFADGRIAETNVTQHQAALSITENQISDFGTYLTSITGEDFLDLSDTPSSYSGQGGKVVRVNSGATALEFSDTGIKFHMQKEGMGGNGTYKVLIKSQEAFDILNASYVTEAGTCNLKVQIDGVDVNGLHSCSANTTVSTTTAVSANNVSVNDPVTVVVSSAASLSNLIVQLWCKRV